MIILVTAGEAIVYLVVIAFWLAFVALVIYLLVDLIRLPIQPVWKVVWIVGCLMLPLLGVLAYIGWRLVIFRRRTPEGACPNCGVSLPASGNFCPACGTASPSNA
jgi:hypothetical protein